MTGFVLQIRGIYRPSIGLTEMVVRLATSKSVEDFKRQARSICGKSIVSQTLAPA